MDSFKTFPGFIKGDMCHELVHKKKKEREL